MNPLPKPLIAAALAAAAAFGLAGCVMSPDVAMSVTTADGQKIEVPFNTAPPPVTDGVVTVQQLQFAPWDLDDQHKVRTLAFTFLLQFKPGSEPANILIEDDTETPILTIFESKDPKIVKNNLWAGVSRPFAPSDEHVNWVLNLDNNVRVYRVTVRLKDGTTHVLLKPVLVPTTMKTYMQKRLETQ